MARGGYRPGAGRKKGSKSKGEIFDSEEKARIEEMLSHGLKAKAKIYSDYLARVKKGDRVTQTEQRLMDKVEAELKSNIAINPKKLPSETPLDFMLRVMNDPNEDKEMRARMATAAAPYLHLRKGDDMGKKEEKDFKAKKAASGLYSAGKPPQLKAVK